MSELTKRDIASMRQIIDRDEREARTKILEKHLAHYGALREHVSKQCEEAGGHEWICLPSNGINQPHFMTGEWPMMCQWCRTHRPFGWTETSTS